MVKRNPSDRRYAWNKGLTADTDERVRTYSEKLRGRAVSDETRALLSKQKSKGRVFYDVCLQCGRKKGHSERPRCVFCAARWRADNYPNAMLGRKLTEAQRQRLLDANSRQIKPTKPELWIADVLDFMFGSTNPFVYTGSGAKKFWINAEGKARRPDFVALHKRQVIEVFGRYWHPPCHEPETIEHYAAAGWECLVIWENETGSVRDKIFEFAYPFEFNAELKEDFKCA